MNDAKGDKKVKLLEIAASVIQKQGIKKTTLDDIAEAAGMASTSMYYYFPSKNDLIHSVLKDLMNKTLVKSKEAIDAARSPEEKLVAIWKVLFSTVSQSGVFLNFTVNTKPEIMLLAGDIRKEFDQKIREQVRAILSDGLNRGVFAIANEDFELFVSVLSNGLLGLVITVIGESEHRQIEEQIEKVGRLLIEGLRKR